VKALLATVLVAGSIYLVGCASSNKYNCGLNPSPQSIRRIGIEDTGRHGRHGLPLYAQKEIKEEIRRAFPNASIIMSPSFVTNLIMSPSTVTNLDEKCDAILELRLDEEGIYATYNTPGRGTVVPSGARVAGTIYVYQYGKMWCARHYSGQVDPPQMITIRANGVMPNDSPYEAAFGKSGFRDVLRSALACIRTTF
jgi:hypothetical protein